MVRNIRNIFNRIRLTDQEVRTLRGVVVALANKNSYQRSKIDVGRAKMSGNNYDFIIVGAGSAGCTLADRLTEDGSNKVLLLEAGGKDWDPLIHVPLAFQKCRSGSFTIGTTSQNPYQGSMAVGLK